LLLSIASIGVFDRASWMSAWLEARGESVVAAGAALRQVLALATRAGPRRRGAR
jgi:hypothetical protein